MKLVIATVWVAAVTVVTLAAFSPNCSDGWLHSEITLSIGGHVILPGCGVKR